MATTGVTDHSGTLCYPSSRSIHRPASPNDFATLPLEDYVASVTQSQEAADNAKSDAAAKKANADQLTATAKAGKIR